MERRVRGNSHARCGVGENPKIASKDYLSLFNDENFNIINQHELLRRYPKAPLRRIGTSRGICG